MKQNTFYYRSYKKRTFIEIIFVPFLVKIQEVLGAKIQESAFVVLCLFTVFVYIYLYILITRNLFLEQGKYIIKAATITIELKHKSYNFNIKEIQKISYIKRNFGGESFAIFSIKSDCKYMKIMSENLEKDVTLKDLNFYDIYESIEQAGDLKKTYDAKTDECYILKHI